MLKKYLQSLIVVSLVVFGVNAVQHVPATHFKALHGPLAAKLGVSSAEYKKPQPKPQSQATQGPTSTFTRAAGGCNRWRSAIAQYSWNVEVAINVCNAESGGRADNDNPGDYHVTCMGSRGLFQIGCDSTSNYAGMFNPYANIKQAFALYSNRGWQPWSFTTCRYKVACY